MRSCTRASFATVLQWPETLQVVDDFNLATVKVDQGSLGHPKAKPSTVLADIEEIKGVNGWKMQGQPEKWPQELDKRIQFSKELATWATGLKGRLRMVSQRREGPDLQGAEGDHGVERALSFRSSTFPQGL